MFEAAFIWLALAASVSAAVSLGILGVYLTFRRIVFLGLVVANAATVGAALGAIAGWNEETVAAGAAILTAIGLGSIRAPRRIAMESIMGWAYATAASTTVLLLAWATAPDTDVLHLLYGNVLAISGDHVAVLAGIAIVVVLLHAICGERFKLVTFDEEGARLSGVRTRAWSLVLNIVIGVATALAVQHIGALLTFALLTMGPMAAMLVASSVRTTFVLSAAITTTSVVLGLAGSFTLDLPPGPLAVAVLAVVVAGAGVSHS